MHTLRVYRFLHELVARGPSPFHRDQATVMTAREAPVPGLG